MSSKIAVKKIVPEYRLNAIRHLSIIPYLSPDDVKEIEEGINEFAISTANKYGHINTSRIFKNIYTNKLMHIVLNLNPDSYVKNTSLADKLIKKELKPRDITDMHYRIMAPDKWDFYNNTESAMVTAVIVTDISLAKTTLFTCSVCKKNECAYYQMQTRSADEGTTNFITCLLCKKNWRQYN